MDEDIEVNEIEKSETGGEGEVELAPECGNCGSRTEWESLVDDDGEDVGFRSAAVGR